MTELNDFSETDALLDDTSGSKGCFDGVYNLCCRILPVVCMFGFSASFVLILSGGMTHRIDIILVGIFLNILCSFYFISLAMHEYKRRRSSD